MNLMRRFNNAMTGTYLACKSELYAHPAAYKRLFAVSVTIGAIFNGTALVFADDIKTFSSDITTTLNDIYNAMFPVISILAAIFAAMALVTRMTSNQQKAAQATSWLIRIGLAYLGLNAIGLILKIIRSTAKDDWYKVDTTAPGT